MKNSTKGIGLMALTAMTMFISGIAGAEEKSVVFGGYSFDEPIPKLTDVLAISVNNDFVRFLPVLDTADPIEKKYFETVLIPTAYPFDAIKPFAIMLSEHEGFPSFKDCRKRMNEVHSFLSKKYNAKPISLLSKKNKVIPTIYERNRLVRLFDYENVKFSEFRNKGSDYFITTGCIVDVNRISLYSNIELKNPNSALIFDYK